MSKDHKTNRLFGSLGLRARITATFIIGAVAVAGLLAASSLVLTRRNLLDERESRAEDRAFVNAESINDRISTPDADIQTFISSLSTAGKPSLLAPDPSDPDGGLLPISLDSNYGVSTLPADLRRFVLEENSAAAMRYSNGDELLLVVGVPVSDGAGAYFEVSQIDDIADSLRDLGIVLGTTSVIAAILAGLVGFRISRRVLRPLGDVAQVAKSISVGKLDARVAYDEFEDDPDLEPLLSSFNEMVAALQDRIDRDARFTSDVSHELRSPLTTFAASLEVLRNAREEMPDRAQIALDLLSSDMERFTQLVEDLLEISRFDAGAVRLEMDEVLIVDAVRLAVHNTVKGEKIPVEAEPSLHGIVVACDRRRLARVLANFIDNARKYGGGATRVGIERGATTDGDAIAPTVRIAVEDSGPGVLPEDRQNIFDRFARGTQGGKRSSDMGVGLGLSLAAEHARLHEGRVYVEDRPDGEAGARFVIELPLVEITDEEPTHEAEAAEPAHPAGTSA